MSSYAAHILNTRCKSGDLKNTMKVFHNEKKGVKEEQNRDIPHLSFSTRKNTPQKKKKSHRKIKPYS